MDIAKVAVAAANQNILHTQKSSFLNKPFLEVSISKRHLNDDMVSISNEAKTLLIADKNQVFKNEQSSITTEMLKHMQESSNQSDNPYSDMQKCIQIAIRIMNGDKVPDKDRVFLAEKEPTMYSNALLLRRQNDKPKKYDSLLEDEKVNLTDDNDIPSPMSSKQPSGVVSVESSSGENIAVSSELEA